MSLLYLFYRGLSQKRKTDGQRETEIHTEPVTYRDRQRETAAESETQTAPTKTWRNGGITREGERERERHIERENERDRQKERHGQKERDRQTER